MRQFRWFVAALAVAALSMPALFAQKTAQVHPGQEGSPHVRSEWTVDGATISIAYGRPFLKGRDEATMMPPGKVWRTGADEATTLTIAGKALMFGPLHVNPGTYTLYTIPNEKTWTLIVSKKTGQWGVPYPEGQDYGRALMTVSKAPAPVEQLTISIEDTNAGGTLTIEWGATRASLPFTTM